MKLEGTLDAFSMPDIFQLLTFTKKTGGLHLASQGADGVVYFAGGAVTGASADGSRQALVRRLIGAGVIDDEALESAVSRATEGNGTGVVKALLEAGAIDATLLRKAVTDQTVDAMFDLLHWLQGDFAFVVDELNPDDVGVTLTVESVVADADSRRESWESVSKVIPTPQSVLSMPVVLPADPDVTREEWSLLALVDGRRSVAELVDLTGSGQYAVVSNLAALVERGLLSVRAAGDADLDHVSTVHRRHRLLAALEGQPFRPVQPEPTSAPPIADVPAPATVEPVQVASQAKHALGPQEPSGLDAPEPQPVEPLAIDSVPSMLGGAHVPGDVTPQRPEPFLPRRTATFDEGALDLPSLPSRGPSTPLSVVGDVVGATAMAVDPDAASVIERDPNVNRSLMLRLIAGVRGL